MHKPRACIVNVQWDHRFEEAAIDPQSHLGRSEGI